MTATSNSNLFAVIGDPIAHSLSPVMHSAAFRALDMDCEYIPVRVERADLPAFLNKARKQLRGFNVTVPHKNAVIAGLDSVSEIARLCGSVNTVSVGADGSLHGDTTDGFGLESAVKEAFDFSFRGASICFIGCGGVVPALAFHAAAQGAAELRIINRTLEKAQDLAQRLKLAFPNLLSSAFSPDQAGKALQNGPQLAVQCTSLGLHPEDPPAIDPDVLPDNILLFETIYRPTALLTAARERGIRVADGHTMLLYQGAKSFELWTGAEAPLDAMRQALEAAQAAKKD